MLNKLKRLVVEEDGYGTVEMILIIAGVGLLATSIFNVLETSIASNTAGSAVNQVGTNINGLLDDWSLGTVAP